MVLDVVGERLAQEVDARLFQDRHHGGVVDVLVHVDVRPAHLHAGGEAVRSQPLVPVPLVRVMLRIWRAATDSVARSRSSSA